MFSSLVKLLEQVKNFIVGLIFALKKYEGPTVPIEVFEPKEKEVEVQKPAEKTEDTL